MVPCYFQEIRLIPIATAIRILNGSFGSSEFVEEIEWLSQGEVQIDLKRFEQTEFWVPSNRR